MILGYPKPTFVARYHRVQPLTYGCHPLADDCRLLLETGQVRSRGRKNTKQATWPARFNGHDIGAWRATNLAAPEPA